MPTPSIATVAAFALAIAPASAQTALPRKPAPTPTPTPAPAAAKSPSTQDRAASSVAVVRFAPDGSMERLATFAGANVSSVTRMKDGRIAAAYQGFPADDPKHFDRVAVRFSSDEGRTWTEPAPIVVTGMDAGLAPPFDPTLVTLPDGRVRLYFISYVETGAPPTATAVHSATSTDGVRYAYEPGVRFTVEGRVVVDATAALHEGVFHIVVPDNGTASEFLARRQRGEPQPGGNGYHATGKDGLAFERVADLTLASTHDRWWGNLLSEDGRLLFLGTGPGPWPLRSKDGARWEPAERPLELGGADPAAVRLRDGALLVLWTQAAEPAATRKENGDA